METPYESLIATHSDIECAIETIKVARYYLEIVIERLRDADIQPSLYWDIYIVEDALSEAKQALERAREWIKNAQQPRTHPLEGEKAPRR
jgi:hypothetical protein